MLDSSCAFSFSNPCALALSFQKPGSSERRAISPARERFRSTSKRPPERVESLLQVGQELGGRCGHGGRVLLAASAPRRRDRSAITSAAAPYRLAAPAKRSPTLV